MRCRSMLVDLETRIFDILISTLLLLLLLPLLIISVGIVYFTIGTPVFFVQTRPGLNNEPFSLLKLRTMNNDVDDNGTVLPDHLRISKAGKFIRKFSLDELPQLINVIRGDMSLVGPRPLLMEYLQLYDEKQIRRHEVRPGLTGLAQISGRNAISWSDKFKLDLEYIDNRSVSVYFKILFKTVHKVFLAHDITSTNSVTVDKFTGNHSPGENND